MKIAIIGIGSTFAFQLSQAGHEVTVVARGQRLERLQQDGAIVKTTTQQAAAHVLFSKCWDLLVARFVHRYNLEIAENILN